MLFEAKFKEQVTNLLPHKKYAMKGSDWKAYFKGNSREEELPVIHA
jgi:hypothetical protein